jgi:hypothetical protein
MFQDEFSTFQDGFAKDTQDSALGRKLQGLMGT